MARKLPIPNGRLDGALDANGMRIVNLMDPMSGDDAATKRYVDEHSGGGGGGTGNYNDLSHKPRIGGHVLDEATTLEQIGAQKKLTAGANVIIEDDGTISASGGSVVESAGNPGYAANADRAAEAGIAGYATESQSAFQAVQSTIAESVPWGGVTDTPSTVDGYGITDAAKKEELGAVSSKVDAIAAYPMLTMVNGAAKDRTVNISPNGGIITFPARTGDNARDFVVRVSSSDTAPSITFPSDVNYESDQDDCWTAEAGKANEWYFSESEPGLFKVMHKALTPVTQ